MAFTERPQLSDDDNSTFSATVALALPDPTLVLDASVEVVWCNRSAEVLFGMTLDDARGRSGIEFLHPDDVQIAALSLASVQGKEVGTLLELRVRSTDGWRLVEVRGAPLGELTVLCLRDLTERRRWELAGDETAKFRSLLQNSATITMLLDETGTVLASSGALTRLLGHDQEVVEGAPLDDLSFPMTCPGCAKRSNGRCVTVWMEPQPASESRCDCADSRANPSRTPSASSTSSRTPPSKDWWSQAMTSPT